MQVLDEAIDRIKREDLLGHIKGAKAVLEVLMCAPLSGDTCRRRSYLNFDRALEIFLSYSAAAVVPEQLKNSDTRKHFREFICSERYGLCVYVYKNTILLRPDDVDLDHFLTFIHENENSSFKEQVCSSELMQSMDKVLESVDTEWDRKVTKVIVGLFCSFSELKILPGIGIELEHLTKEVLNVIRTTDEIKAEAKADVDTHLSSLSNELETKLKKMQNRRNDLVLDWSEEKLGEFDDDIEDLQQRIIDIKHVHHPEEASSETERKQCQKKLEMMRKRKFSKIVEKRRLKARKLGAGRKRMMDEVDERHLLKMIETKSVAHGRRGDEVCYTNRRVKKRDMKKIVNMNRRKRGLSTLKSVTAVYNRGRARNKRSRQAKLHIGLGLFCTKKAPKGEDNENETTHYLRSFKRNVDRHHYVANKADAAYVLEVSSDDKAYLQPGTSTGFRSARCQKIIQSSDESKARKLPKYDFPTYMVNITPGTYRYLSKDYVEVEGSKPRKVLTSDSTYVFVRPKHWVGSSGEVWASEAMQLRHEIPHKYLVDTADCQDKHFLALKVMLKDILAYYIDSTHAEDISKISESESCIHRKYEESRLYTLRRTVWKAFSFSTVLHPENLPHYEKLKAELLPLSDMINQLAILLSTESPQNLATKLDQLCSKCSTVHKMISLPRMKTKIIESTDAGPGVSIHQHDVQMRIGQRIRIQDNDYYIRYHLANGDSSYNEVERCQSYIGDALCDGSTIEWERQKLLDPQKVDILKRMSLEELQAAEEKRMVHNARMVCKEIQSKLDGAVAPNGYMKAFTNLSTEELFFNDAEFLDMFLSKGVRERPESPGGHYYAKVLSFLKSHCHAGEKYLEFVKGACEKNGIVCDYCTKHPWVGPKTTRVPAPFPDVSQLPAFHYLDVLTTPTKDDKGKPRLIDDFQPRVHLKKLVSNGSISLNDPSSIDSFSKKFIVQRPLVISALEHLQLLQIRKEKKEERKNLEKQQVINYEDIDWKDVGEKNTFMKLSVKTLNLYLEKHELSDQVSFRKPEKCSFIRGHIIFKQFQDNLRTNEDQQEEDKQSEDDGNEEEEEVIRVVGGSDDPVQTEDEVDDPDDMESKDSDCSDEEDGSDADHDPMDVSDSNFEDFDSVTGESDNVCDIFTTTRSGRETRTWRASDYM